MKIGLLYEGHLDQESLQIIIKRIIGETGKDPESVIFVPYPASGSIDGYIRLAAILFYDTHSCDLGVFVADTDGQDSKRRRIKQAVARHCRNINASANFVVGFPDPELEQWFLDEEDAIKNNFSLEGNRRLPYADMPSKERFKKIVSEKRQDITITISEYYAKVAVSVNLGKLYRSSDSFRSFYNAIKRAI